MTYRLIMIVQNNRDTHTVTTRIAGCVDVADAKRKAREIYNVIAFRKVEEAND